MSQFIAYFVVMLMFCEPVNSLETTTSPQQQTTGVTKDLCEVQIRLPLLMTMILLIISFKDFVLWVSTEVHN